MWGDEDVGAEVRAFSAKLAGKKLEALYHIHERDFSQDVKHKQDRIKKAADEVFVALDAAGPATTRVDRALAAYIRGRAHDVFDDYSPESEHQLSISVKLNPEKVEAWNTLGHCLWKKGDLRLAKVCFERALKQRKNAESLRQLSMMLRQIPTQSEKNHMENVKESIARGKEAVSEDVNDPKSWYVLGNAYLTLFFSLSHSPSDLDRSLAAYNRAIDLDSDGHPDLHFNRASVCQYKQQFTDAVQSYQRAQQADPTLPAHDAIDSIVRHVTRISTLIERKGRLKAKKMASLVASLTSSPSGGVATTHERVQLSSLRDGENKGKFVALKLVVTANVSDLPPACLIMVDADTTCIALCVYNLDTDAPSRWSDRDTFAVLNPQLKRVNFSHGGSNVKYNFLEITDPTRFIINGKSSEDSHAFEQLKLNLFS